MRRTREEAEMTRRRVIEAALKLFKTTTGRRSVIAFHGAYHGMTAGAMGLQFFW